ncbi:MAG: creatininase family protein [Paramuribaculum sp.]
MIPDKIHDLSVSNYGTARSEAYDVAILPWGATEPHNLHLPYLTDAILSHDIAVDAAREADRRYGIRAMVMPAMPLGAQNPGQRELPFCVHYRYDTQRAVLTDIVASLHHQGMRRLLIVNGHGGNSFKNMIRDLSVDIPDMLIATSEWFKVCPPKEYFDAPGDHADELETSVMMHYHPELVDLSEAGSGTAGGFAPATLREGVAWVPRNWSRVSKDTGIGSPAAATARKGARFAAAVVARYAELLRDLCLDDLYMPL